MILRKPYAFIIRHFRLIHIIMLVCLSLVLRLASDIRDIFATMQETNTYTYAQALTAVDKRIYSFIFVILFLSAVLFWLLKEKKKPTGIYLLLILYCALFYIGFAYEFYLLGKIAENIVKSDLIILGKDIGFIIKLPTYFFMVICFIRGIGFNLKQFNFSKDVEELQIVDKDSAEFEVLIGQNNYKYARFARRSARETKYYILENKFMFTCILFSIVVVFLGIGVYYYNAYLKALKAQESSVVNNIAYTIRNSYITGHDFNGNVIDEDYKFVVLDMSFYNSGREEQALDSTILTLANDELFYYPTYIYKSKFYDLGTPYLPEIKIQPGESFDGTLTFKIPTTVTTTNFTFRVEYSVDETKKDFISKYKKFEVRAQNIDKENAIINKTFNEAINTNVVDRNDYSLTISDYAFADVYDSKFMLCRDISLCSPFSAVVKPQDVREQTLLVLNYSSVIENDPVFMKRFNTSEKIFGNFLEVRYSLLGKDYVEKASVINNTNVADKIFVNVDRRILKAPDIDLLFHFRDETYVISLKSSAVKEEEKIEAKDEIIVEE